MSSGREIDAQVGRLRAAHGVDDRTPLYVTPVMWSFLAEQGADMRNFRLVEALGNEPPPAIDVTSKSPH